ncbi:MAG: sugar ABC transporter permease [Ardenticatenaceae bacterium]|nr:sugar ABC transporter permease [Anaerolineales bacterium]MCB8917512.1 sugar ABC transporter permease [Ardenticatenaceae bacterium]
MRSRPSYHTQLRLFLLPYLAGSLILVILPALATFAVAFTEYNAVQPPRWVGLANFAKLYNSALVRISLRSTVTFLLAAIPLRIVGALCLALLLQSRRRGFGLGRAAIYLPTVIPEVAYAIIWLWVFNPLYGPLNKLLALLGIFNVNWLAEPGTAQLAIIIMVLFTIGEGFVVMLAGLQNIPRAYFEAATADGATPWQAFWRITFPLILPWLLLLSFRDLIISMQNTFTPSFVMTYGGPYYATTYVPLLIYELAFDFFDFGMAAAALIITYLLLLMLIAGVLNIVRGWLDA